MAKFGVSSILRVDVLASTIRRQQLRLDFNYYKNACNKSEWRMGGASGMGCVIWAPQMLVDLILVDLITGLKNRGKVTWPIQVSNL